MMYIMYFSGEKNRKTVCVCVCVMHQEDLVRMIRWTEEGETSLKDFPGSTVEE